MTENTSNKFGTFTGVFVPTFLGIIGVILFLRLGYIVGSIGIFGTIVIILMAVSVTLSTSLSLSSLTSNIKVKEGGVYSIISKTLGLEAAGSVGIPLYFAQLFSVTLYLFGFSEIWTYFFPNHNIYVVLTVAFLSIFALTFVSLKSAIRAQLIIFGLILVSLISFFGGADWLPNNTDNLFNSYFIDEGGFWALFALFFPAVTGIIAGIGLSGELREPDKQIPRGLIGAITVTTLIYILVAILLSFSSTKGELLNNSTIIIDIAAIGSIAFIGILAASFSSALTTFVSSPLLLEAMAKDSLIFKGKVFIRNNNSVVPRNAVLFSAIPILITLYIANLDSIAPIITMLFLITYTMINLIAFIEQSIGIVSFRPKINIPKFVPLYGIIAPITFMFFIDPIAGIFASIFVLFIYILLLKKKKFSSEGDIRQGLFATISECAAKKAHDMPQSTRFTWKPNIMIPVTNSSTLSYNWPIIKSITYPNGTLTVLGIEIENNRNNKSKNLGFKGIASVLKKCNREGVFTSASNLTSGCYVDAVSISLEAIQGDKLPPNILYLPYTGKKLHLKSIRKIFQAAKKHKVGVIISEDTNIRKQVVNKQINVWIPSNTLGSDLFMERKFDLALLVAYKLYKNEKGKIIIRACVESKDKGRAERYINKLINESRFPENCELIISTMTFLETLSHATDKEIHLIPITKYTDIAHVRKIRSINKKSILYILDSGREDVLA